MTAPDMFALGGQQDDAEILSLFREWIEAYRAQDRIIKPYPDTDAQDLPAWVTAQDHIDDLEQRIADIPAEGAVGLAAKAYMASFQHHGGSYKDAAAIWGRAEMREVEAALLEDAARFVPEIRELTRWVLE
jgi:hypothetical protein